MGSVVWGLWGTLLGGVVWGVWFGDLFGDVMLGYWDPPILEGWTTVIHSFYVLLFTRMHNDMMAKNDRSHLPTPRKTKKSKTKPYTCTKQAKQAAKRVLKRKPAQ